MTTGQQGRGPCPGPGYGLVTEQDGTEHWEPSWPTSPGSEPVEEDGFPDIAILCEPCYESGSWDSIWPGGGHDNEPVWGVAEVETGDDGEWIVTWYMTGLTVAQAEEQLERMDFPGGFHRMS